MMAEEVFNVVNDERESRISDTYATSGRALVPKADVYL